MRLSLIRLARVRLSLIRLRPGSCPALPGDGAGRLPGSRAPAPLAELSLAELSLTELSLTGHPVGTLLRSGALP